MIILFILGVLLGSVAVVFALQNTAVITVTFFAWNFTGSLALILMLAISSGILITLLLLLPEFVDEYIRHKILKKENVMLTEDLRRQKELTVFAKEVYPTRENLFRIERGAIEESYIPNLPRQLAASVRAPNDILYSVW